MQKRILYRLVFIAIAIFMMSCHSPELKTDVIIQGTVKNFRYYTDNYTSVKVLVNDFVADQQVTHRAKISDDGTYSLQFPKYHPQDVWLQYGGKLVTIFVSPGNNMIINFDANDLVEAKRGEPLNSFHFEGDDADINTTMADFLPKYEIFNMERWQEHHPKIKELSAEEYKNTVIIGWKKKWIFCRIISRLIRCARTLKPGPTTNSI